MPRMQHFNLLTEQQIKDVMALLLDPASPVNKLAPALVENLRKMLQELLHNGLIVPTSSPVAAPLLMVKKPDGSYRLCIDYRKLNAVTIKDRYPLPNPSMIFDRLSGCTFFSKLDLRWGYLQLRLEDPDDKTAFRSPLGSFAWKVMAMGLTNAAPTFQRLMDSIFRDLEFVSCYLDDIMIASKSEEEHLQHIDIVLQRLQQYNLLVRETKCAFFMSEIKFLGYVFSAQGKAVDQSKITAIRQVPRPDTVHDLQRWLGQVNYYSMFIPKYAEMIAPLTDLLKGTSSTKKKAVSDAVRMANAPPESVRCCPGGTGLTTCPQTVRPFPTVQGRGGRVRGGGQRGFTPTACRGVASCGLLLSQAVPS
jgi:putative transposase